MSLSSRMTHVGVWGPVLALAILPDVATIGRAEDFRVENRVFAGGKKTAVSRSTTVFLDGVVYDYLENPAEIIVFEKDRSRFTLLDTTRRVRAELPTQKVAEFTEKLRQSASQQKDPFVRFLADPKFEEQYDEDSGELTLSSSWMTYRLELVDAGSSAIAQQYREFSDWYARVNAVLNPGSKPPFARVLVNVAMAKREATAREVHLTMTPKRTFPPKRVKLRSEHQFVHQIVQADADRAVQTRQFMQIYKLVGFAEYIGGEDR